MNSKEEKSIDAFLKPHQYPETTAESMQDVHSRDLHILDGDGGIC